VREKRRGGGDHGRIELSSWPERSRPIACREHPIPARSCRSPTTTTTAFKRSSPTGPTRTSRWSSAASAPASMTGSAMKEARPGQVPLQRVRAERRVAGDPAARPRPDRLGPSAAPRRRMAKAEPRRLRYCLLHIAGLGVPPPPREAPPPGCLPMGGRVRPCVRQAQDDANPRPRGVKPTSCASA
jgi:hypothetical protein